VAGGGDRCRTHGPRRARAGHAMVMVGVACGGMVVICCS
jgi:hypothetical protein